MSGQTAVALVGCGKWGRHILRDLVGLGCDVAVVDPSAANAGRALQLGARAAVSSTDALPAVAGVVVATPATVHADSVEQVLPLGVPVFVEKPLTVDPLSAARLVAASGGRLFVMDKWRYHPGVRLLSDIVRDGRLGRVNGLRTVRTDWGNPHTDVDVVWTLAPHELAIALEVFGAVPPARRAVADVENGELVGLTGVLGDGPWHVLEVSSRSERLSREIRLSCTDGVAVLAGGWVDHVVIYRDHTAPRPSGQVLSISTDLPLLLELQAFVEHLRGGPAPNSTAAEGLAVVEAIAHLRALAGCSGR